MKTETSKKINKKYGKTIKKIRIMLNLDQHGLAKLLDTAQATISNSENGRRYMSFRNCHKLVKLANQQNIEIKLEDIMPIE
jgi:predicted transcriptional regulator